MKRAIFPKRAERSDKLNALLDVGLGYLQLGQAGRLFRRRSAARQAGMNSPRKQPSYVYILDEPQRFAFRRHRKLLQVLMKLRDSGNTSS